MTAIQIKVCGKRKSRTNHSKGMLAEAFGQSYADYRAKVRRWI